MTNHNMLGPVVDHQNPLYCPEFSASAYLQSLQRRLHPPRKLHTFSENPASWPDRKLAKTKSFAKILKHALLLNDHNNGNNDNPGPLANRRYRHPSSDTASCSSSFDSAYHQHHCLQSPRRTVKRASPSSFHELQGPPKRARSLLASDSEASSVAPIERPRLRAFSSVSSGSTESTQILEEGREPSQIDALSIVKGLTNRIQDLEGALSL
jgi:hypothetical protein